MRAKDNIFELCDVIRETSFTSPVFASRAFRESIREWTGAQIAKSVTDSGAAISPESL
jgi:hypothetical protein